jgi:hypothetical protein
MRRVEGGRSKARGPLPKYKRRLLCEVLHRNDHGMQRIYDLPVTGDGRKEMDFSRFFKKGARVTLMANALATQK